MCSNKPSKTSSLSALSAVSGAFRPCARKPNALGSQQSLHPRKTSGWIPKMKVWNSDLLSKEVIFRFKVSFRGSIFSCMEVLASSNPSVHGGASGAMMNYHQPPKKSSTFMGKNHPTLPYICCIV